MNTPRSEELDFSRIQDLVRSTSKRGSRLTVAFECPATAKVATITVDVVQANDNAFATKARSSLHTAAVKSVQRTVSRTLRGWFGNNVLGKLAGEVADDKVTAVGATGGFSETEIQTAIVAAFTQVQDQFTYQAEGERYVHRSVAQ